MIRSYAFLLFLSMFALADASTFVPIPIDKQIESSSGAAEVELINTNVYKNATNQIMTEYVFKILNLVNFSNEEFPGGELHLHLPGGSLNGVTTMIIGAPKFELNKPIFLMLKKVEATIYLSNYSVGKFNIQKIDGEDYLVNEVFPMQPNVGRIKKIKMLELMKEKWKITEVSKNQNSIQKFTEQKISHTDQQKMANERVPANEEKAPFSISQWLVLLLAPIGIIFSLLLVKKGKKEGE